MRGSSRRSSTRWRALLEGDPALFERLYAAIASGDRDGINRTLVSLGALEHDADRRLRVLAGRVSGSIDALSNEARERELRSIWALAVLSALTLAVGLVVSLHVRRLLAPLARVTERAPLGRARRPRRRARCAPSDDEIGQLEAAFEKMVAGLSRAQALALSNERLAAIGKMAAHVTHEIRNPLSAMGLNIELLEEEISRGEGDRAPRR